MTAATVAAASNWDILINLIKTFFYYRLTYEPLRLPSYVALRLTDQIRSFFLLVAQGPSLKRISFGYTCVLLVHFSSLLAKNYFFHCNRRKKNV